MGEFSKELCGGTHVKSTGEVGNFRIESEESIGSGIRRITVLTGYNAYKYAIGQQDMLNQIAGMLKMNSLTGVVGKVNAALEENVSLKQTIGGLKNQMMLLQADEILSEAFEHGELKVLVKKVDCESGQLKNLAQTLIGKLKEGVVFLGCVNEGKVMFVAECSPKAQSEGYKASDLVKKAAQICGGNGGGRPDEASAGGKDASKITDALSEIRNLF